MLEQKKKKHTTKYTMTANQQLIYHPPEITWSKEYNFRGSDHFLIIQRDERDIPTKQQRI